MARRGRPRHPDILTPREWEVLELLREGLSNPEIATRLGITREGMKYHVSEILGKLGVSTRQEAAAWERDRQRPWWLAASAPLALIVRKLPAGWLPAASAGLAAVTVAAGVGVLVWGLARTDGSGGTPVASRAATPTLTPVSPSAVESPDDLVWEAEGTDTRIVSDEGPTWGNAATAEAYGMPTTLHV